MSSFWFQGDLLPPDLRIVQFLYFYFVPIFHVKNIHKCPLPLTWGAKLWFIEAILYKPCDVLKGQQIQKWFLISEVCEECVAFSKNAKLVGKSRYKSVNECISQTIITDLFCSNLRSVMFWSTKNISLWYFADPIPPNVKVFTFQVHSSLKTFPEAARGAVLPADLINDAIISPCTQVVVLTCKGRRRKREKDEGDKLGS